MTLPGGRVIDADRECSLSNCLRTWLAARTALNLLSDLEDALLEEKEKF
jgi:hypothetical protein